VLTVDLPRALELIAQSPAAKNPPKELGPHPADGKPVSLRQGRFGPYVQHGKLLATLPKADRDEGNLTLARAVEILAAKAAKDGPATAKKGKAAAATAEDKRRRLRRKRRLKKTLNSFPHPCSNDSTCAADRRQDLMRHTFFCQPAAIKDNPSCLS